MPSGGATKYSHSASNTPAGRADPRLRAGFMLIPESGDSSEMKVATRQAANTPVNGASRGRLVLASTTLIIRNEMASSAAKAIPTPAGPGRVTT